MASLIDSTKESPVDGGLHLGIIETESRMMAWSQVYQAGRFIQSGRVNEGAAQWTNLAAM